MAVGICAVFRQSVKLAGQIIISFSILCWPAAAQQARLPQPVVIKDVHGLPQAFVSGIVQDKRGFIWMGTLDGLCRYDGNWFKVFRPSRGGQTSLSGTGITSLKTGPDGNLWISTSRNIDRFDPLTEQVTNISALPFYKKQFGYNISSMFAAGKDQLWIGFAFDGLAWIDIKSQHFRHFRHRPSDAGSISSDTVYSVLKDRKGRVWVATHRGLDRLDQSTGKFHHIGHDPADAASLPNEDIIGLHETRVGDLLIISRNHLTRKVSGKESCQKYRLPRPLQRNAPAIFTDDGTGSVYIGCGDPLYHFDGSRLQELNHSEDPWTPASLLIDRSSVLWVGTTGAGLRKFDLKRASFESRPYHSGFMGDLLGDILHIRNPFPRSSPYAFRYTFYGSHKMMFNAGYAPFYSLDLSTRKMTAIPFPKPITAFNEYYPVPLATDPQGRVWAIHDSTAYYYDDAMRQWSKFKYTVLPGNAQASPTSDRKTAILHFTVDNDALWIASGARGLFRVDRHNGGVRQYIHQPGRPSSLSHNTLFCIFQDPDEASVLWIGTFGGGLCRFDKRSRLVRRFTTDNGLPNDVIYAAIPDRQGFLWIATNRGIARLNRKTFQIRTFSHEDGLVANEFNRFHFLQLPDDRIVLGGLEGITSFHPGQLGDDSFRTPVEITNFYINNQPISPGTTDSLPAQMVRELDLPYDQNFITVQFAGLQYNNTGKLRYRYRLRGIDKKWIFTDRPEAIYTNLSPGRYKLRINASNTSGLWSPYFRELTITIHPPLWATWPAYLLYAIIIFATMYGLLRSYLKHEEAAQLRLVDEMKSRFFANITHEFRTPLTLIISPAQQLRKSVGEPGARDQNLKRIDAIDRNAGRLLLLVNQLLDISRLDGRAMPVELIERDLRAFVADLVHSFDEQSIENGITLSLTTHLPQPLYRFDAGKLERILYNLLTNALKFTGAHGIVDVDLTGGAEGCWLKVADNGPGISADQLPYIFDRFYQAADSPASLQQGTGIGLALVKELTTLLKGSIDVSSEPCVRTVFTVFLPFLPVAHPGNGPGAEKRDAATVPEVPPLTLTDEEPAEILIVEDHAEMAAFMMDSLPSGCRVHLAQNGQEGLQRAISVMPDLVISDVLMPVMDGFALCAELKSDERTAHIPVILLTAKASQQARIEGLTLGADDYLTKPFHSDELQLRVRNQLEQRRRYREWVRARIEQTVPGTSGEERQDPFLSKLYSLIDSNLENASFGVEEISRELGMHRMTLLRKTKAVTNMSPSEIIRRYRFKRAGEYLHRGVSVTEVAYKIGFDNLSYFSKSFRELYGMTPSDFIKMRKHSSPDGHTSPSID